jgi:hypothetical protein
MSDHATVHEEAIGHVRLRIVIDPEPRDPRTEYDNAATMACWHRRYRLGDADGSTELRDAVRASRGHCPHDDDLDDPYVLRTALTRCRDIVWLPLYLYDHGGITMSTSRGYPFNDRWDAGQVGFVFMTRAQILTEFAPSGPKRLTSHLRARAEALMRAEVATYDQFLTGDVFGYVVENDAGEHLDSCWAYFGREACIEEARSVALHVAAAIDAEHRASLAHELEAARPDLYADAALR